MQLLRRIRRLHDEEFSIRIARHETHIVYWTIEKIAHIDEVPLKCIAWIHPENFVRK